MHLERRQPREKRSVYGVQYSSMIVIHFTVLRASYSGTNGNCTTFSCIYCYNVGFEPENYVTVYNLKLVIIFSNSILFSLTRRIFLTINRVLMIISLFSWPRKGEKKEMLVPLKDQRFKDVNWRERYLEVYWSTLFVVHDILSSSFSNTFATYYHKQDVNVLLSPHLT